jgi:hypothetical protein
VIITNGNTAAMGNIESIRDMKITPNLESTSGFMQTKGRPTRPSAAARSRAHPGVRLNRDKRVKTL